MSILLISLVAYSISGLNTLWQYSQIVSDVRQKSIIFLNKNFLGRYIEMPDMFRETVEI